MSPTPYHQACVHTAAELLKYAVDKQQTYAVGTPEYATYGQAAHLLGAFFRIVAAQASAQLSEEHQ